MEQANGRAAAPMHQQTTPQLGRRHFKNLLKNNDLGIVDNPLIYRGPEDLRKDVHAFYIQYQLEDVLDEELLVRGARLAQDDVLFKASGDLRRIEREALRKEENPKLREQSKELNVILLTCCIGAIVQGWSQASIIGANLQWPYAFGLQSDYGDSRKITNFWIFGGVNAITYFAASSIGAWLSDPLNEYFWGRRGALFIASLFTFAASIGSAFTYSWKTLFVCRLFLGIGYGAKASVVPIFESEVCPPNTRGQLLVSWQTFTAIGILLGSAVNLVFHGPQNVSSPGFPASDDGWRQKVAWRLQIASAAIPAIPLLCLAFLCSDGAGDLYYIYAQLRVETLLFSKNPEIERQLEDWSDYDMYEQEAKTSSYWKRVLQLFTVSRNRRASLAACTVMASQQLSGINIFAFLSTTLFSDGSSNPIESLWLSFGFAASNAVFSPVAYWFIDGKGRRFLLLASLTAMVPLLLATAFSFKLQDPTVKHAVVEVFVILYTAAYSPGAGVVPFLYSSEVFPLINREAGMSLSCSVNFMLAGLLALTVPQLNHALGPTRLLGLFAGLDAVAALLVWLFVPGTVQVTTLEEMNYIFGVPTKRHVQYQIRDVLPWIIKRCIPGRRAGRLIPLYTWNRQRQQEELQPWPRNGSQTQPAINEMDEAVESPIVTIPKDNIVVS